MARVGGPSRCAYAPRVTLEALNTLDHAAFAEALGGIYEGSPWVAARVGDRCPFSSVAALAEAMQQTVLHASCDEQIALIRAHPELGTPTPAGGAISERSVAEQVAAGLGAATPSELARLRDANAAYAARFGFPFVVAVKGHTPGSILAVLEQRLRHDREAEIAESLAQIGLIARYRLEALLDA